MATLLEIRAKADAKLAEFWISLREKQNAYYAKHGKYFQLLVSPTSDVIDGVDSDFLTRKPSDEKFLLDVDFTWTTKIPFQIHVDEWTDGKQAGYSATVFVKLKDGRVFTRTRDSQNVDSGWSEYIKP